MDHRYRCGAGRCWGVHSRCPSLAGHRDTPLRRTREAGHGDTPLRRDTGGGSRGHTTFLPGWRDTPSQNAPLELLALLGGTSGDTPLYSPRWGHTILQNYRRTSLRRQYACDNVGCKTALKNLEIPRCRQESRAPQSLQKLQIPRPKKRPRTRSSREEYPATPITVTPRMALRRAASTPGRIRPSPIPTARQTHLEECSLPQSWVRNIKSWPYN